ncbi:hypothetical protein [Microcoleus sp. B9-D4]|uniref:hypothetical protein n=1 Tax=Microcoleus sp. B9-D4 TaxID=2818711 RepID=UPI002FD33EC3
MLAERATIYLGSIPLEVFMLPDGRYVLSQTQVAEAVGKTEVSFRDFVTSKSPEALPYKGFRPAKLSIKGNNIKINTIPIDVASAYWTKEAIVGNVTAARLLGACTAESIERRADSAFGVQRAEEERQEFIKQRMASKQVRRQLTDAIKAYIDRHPELSDNNRKWLYVNASQRVTLVVFGRKAKKLAEDLGVAPDNLRDALTPHELIMLQEVEDTAVRLIDIQDRHPDDAIQQSAERLLIQVQNRALKLK